MRRKINAVSVTYDSQIEVAYIRVTGTELSPGRRTVPCEFPDGSWASVNVDFKGGRLVGIEILGANDRLHPEILAEAE